MASREGRRDASCRISPHRFTLVQVWNNLFGVPALCVARVNETMPAAEYTLFSTSIGHCGVAWADGKLVATHLPEKDDEETCVRLARRAANATKGEPPLTVQRAIAAIATVLAGERVDLSFIECDFSTVDRFNMQVYEVARTIPAGETLTYGDIAMRLGDKKRAQAVGRALGQNPFPIIVPCHRVIGANGRLTGFSANGGIETKLRLLSIEGATIGEAPTLFENLPLAVNAVRRTEY